MSKIVEVMAALPAGTLEQVDKARDTKELAVGIGCIAILVIGALWLAHRK